MKLHHVGVCLGLSLLVLYGSSDEVMPSLTPPWLRHFTSLIGQEMDCLEKKVDAKTGATLAQELDAKTSFGDIVKLLKTLTAEEPPSQLHL